MNRPHIIQKPSFKDAWTEAVCFLSTNQWECWNLIVQITDATLFDPTFNELFTEHCRGQRMKTPRQVCNTIFPISLSSVYNTRHQFYRKYLDKYYPQAQKKSRRWGTYFHRMINYRNSGPPINQLENIITAINTRTTTCRAAYTILIQIPGSETKLKLGGPCLNYIAVQLEKGTPSRLSLLAVYRNHDFLERAYGNYWGLCSLLNFLCRETSSAPGQLTCISSHAYIAKHKPSLLSFIGTQCH